MKDLKCYIAGEWRTSEKQFDKCSPVTGKKIATVHEASKAMVDEAVAKGQAVVDGEWGNSSVKERVAFLNKIADEMIRRGDELVAAEVADTGRPYNVSKNHDDLHSANIFKAFAAELLTYNTTSNRFSGWNGEDAMYYTMRRPRGVIGAIAPWNMPLLLMAMKIAPALAMGNAVVCKPSEDTPSSCSLLAEIIDSVGLPKGVFSMVHGFGLDSAGDFISSHPDIAAVSFTGAVPTGKAIMKAAADRIADVNLELGGKNPALVFADADLDKAVERLARAVVYNCGQICFCAERIYVERSIFDEFTKRLVERISQVPVGDPEGCGLAIGPLVSKSHREKVLELYRSAKEEGGNILLGGGVPKFGDERDEGYFVEPTVVTGLDPEARILREEVFGPITHIAPFDTEEEALAQANNTEFGLAASIWSQDISRAHRVAHKVDAGTIWINTWQMRDFRAPLSGTGQSALGHQGGVESLEFMSELSTVTVVL